MNITFCRILMYFIINNCTCISINYVFIIVQTLFNKIINISPFNYKYLVIKSVEPSVRRNMAIMNREKERFTQEKKLYKLYSQS